ncbi:MAG: hypothetical protein LBG87_01080, partial [Spirochaetaceae bacterium]|nr:hypothetical protein [Spirochaetaceae bacterium]
MASFDRYHTFWITTLSHIEPVRFHLEPPGLFTERLLQIFKPERNHYMTILLTITGVTEQNRYDKLVKTASLSDQMRLNAGIDYPGMDKSFKYISRKWENDGWKYTYPDTGGGGGGSPAEPPLITGVTPITVNSQNYGEIAKQEFKKLEARIKTGLHCTALKGRMIAGIRRKHLKSTKGKRRSENDIMQRVALMPYIIPIIEQGSHTETRNTEQGISYKITGQVHEKNEDKNISVILIEDAKTHLLYFSIFYDTTSVSKSMTQMGGLFPSGRSFGFPSRLGRVHGLDSLDRGLSIPIVSAVSMETLPDIEVLIKNITAGNRKAKFAKAVRAVAKVL